MIIVFILVKISVLGVVQVGNSFARFKIRWFIKEIVYLGNELRSQHGAIIKKITSKKIIRLGA